MKKKQTKKIEVSGDNWKVGGNYFQEYPTAYLRAEIKDETTLPLYHDSLEAFKRSIYAKMTKTSSGQYKIKREADTALYSRDMDRLVLIAFESKLKKGVQRYGTFHEACLKIALPLHIGKQPEQLKRSRHEIQ